MKPDGSCPVGIADIEEAHDAVLMVRDCEDETCLIQVVRAIVRFVRAEQFVFLSCAKDEREVASYRYLIGCNPKWCQMYNARKWREVDPFLVYARHHSRPILVSDIDQNALSAGQQALMHAATEYGFRSGIVLPSSRPLSSRVGVLYIASSESKEVVNPLLYRYQGLLSQLSRELLDWVINRATIDELGEVQLDRLERIILRYCFQGFTAEQIARLCGLPVHRVKNVIRRLNSKFGVSDRRQAVQRAIELDLIRPHEWGGDDIRGSS